MDVLTMPLSKDWLSCFHKATGALESSVLRNLSNQGRRDDDDDSSDDDSDSFPVDVRKELRHVWEVHVYCTHHSSGACAILLGSRTMHYGRAPTAVDCACGASSQDWRNQNLSERFSHRAEEWLLSGNKMQMKDFTADISDDESHTEGRTRRRCATEWVSDDEVQPPLHCRNEA
jgi:hypothetical protein